MTDPSLHEIKEVLAYGITETDEAQSYLITAKEDSEQMAAGIPELRNAVLQPARLAAEAGKIARILGSQVTSLQRREAIVSERITEVINGGGHTHKSIEEVAGDAQTIASNARANRNRILAVSDTTPKDEREAAFLEDVASTGELAGAAVVEAEAMPGLIRSIGKSLEEFAASNKATSQLWKDALAGNVAKILAAAERIENRAPVIGNHCDDLSDAIGQYGTNLDDAARSNAAVKEAAETYRNNL